MTPKPRWWKGRTARFVEDYLLLTGGALVVAAGVDMFLTPNQVVAAGVTGVAMLLHFTWKWPVGLVTLTLNVPLLAAGLRWGGGWRVLFRTVFLVSNTLILLLSIPVVGLVPVLYALIVNYISSRVLDTVQEGLGYARAVTIVTSKPEELRAAVLEQVGRGLTVLQGLGGFSQEPKPVLYVVVSRSQISSLKRLIADKDPQAFVVVSEAHEVLGEGFRPVAEA